MAYNSWVAMREQALFLKALGKRALNRDLNKGWNSWFDYLDDQEERLYAETLHERSKLNSFRRSPVRCEAPAGATCNARYPRFADAEYLETILAPGEALYIPHGAWHYVRSLSTSVSVNLWW